MSRTLRLVFKTSTDISKWRWLLLGRKIHALVHYRCVSLRRKRWFVSKRYFVLGIYDASGSEQFIGMAGEAAYSGIAIGLYELTAPFLLILLGWVFAPLYAHCQIRTTPEYMEMRFNRLCRFISFQNVPKTIFRTIFVCLLIATHIFSTIAATLSAGAIVLEVVAGWSIWQSAPMIVIFTAIYTISGGLKAKPHPLVLSIFFSRPSCSLTLSKPSFC